MRGFGLLLLMLGWSLGLSAAVLEATGVAPFNGKNIEQARQQAMQDALRQMATHSQEVAVSSVQSLHNGQVNEQVTVHNQSQLRDVEVVHEAAAGGVLQVRVRAQLDTDPQACPAETANGYAKSLAVTGFPLRGLDQATLGGLFHIGEHVSLQLVGAMNTQGVLSAIDASYWQPFGDQVNRPVSQRVPNPEAVKDIARRLDSQFVLAGHILELGFALPVVEEMPAATGWQRWVPKWPLSETMHKPLRRFVLQVFLHDGLTGELLLQHTVSREGDWPFAKQQSVALASAQFARSDYGQVLQQALTEVQHKVEDELRCLAYIAEIVRVEEDKVYFRGGYAQRIRPGDTLSVYRTSTFYDVTGTQSQLQLASTGNRLTVSQVQPQFTIGTLPLPARYINIKAGDLVIAR